MFNRRTAGLLGAMMVVVVACGARVPRRRQRRFRPPLSRRRRHRYGCGNRTDTAAATAPTTAATTAPTTAATTGASTGPSGSATACSVGVSWNNFQQPRWAAHDKPDIEQTVEAGGGTYTERDANLSSEQQATDIQTMVNRASTY